MGGSTVPFRKLKGGFELAFSPNGLLVAVVDKKVRLWEFPEHGSGRTIDVVRNPSYVDFSLDGNSIAIKSTSGQVVIVDLITGQTKEIVKKSSEGCEILFTASGCLVDGTWKGELCAWDQLGHRVFREAYPDSMIQKISADKRRGTFIYVAGKICREGSLVPDKVCVRQWPFDAHKERVLGYQQNIDDLALSPSGERCAVIHPEGDCKSLEVFDLKTEKMQLQQELVQVVRSKVAWSSDEKYLAVAGDDQIIIFDSAQLKQIERIHCRYASAVCFSPVNSAVVGYLGWNSGGYLEIS